MLTDAGPLVALIDADDQHHELCIAALAILPVEPMLTTWACFAETMHVLWRRGRYRYQATLWNMHREGRLALHQSTPAETVRMAALMEQYRDAPMDLGDASIIATAEALGLRRVFTLDRQFYVYRLGDGGALTVVP